jgi:hypothetical protein
MVESEPATSSTQSSDPKSTGTPGWGQSDLFRLSGWGQLPDNQGGRPTGPRSWFDHELVQREPRVDPYTGPIETWPNFKTVSDSEWELFRENQVVYTDGTNVPGIEAGWFLCVLCDKRCACKDLLQMHLDSSKHKRNIQWLISQNKEVASTLKCPADYASEVVLSEGDKEILRLNRCVVEDEWIVCTLCNKKLGAIYNVLEHIGTQKHRNNLNWANSVDGTFTADKFSELPPSIEMTSSGYYCTLCDASMGSSTILELHLCAQRHLQNSGVRDPLYPLDDCEIPIREGIELSRLAELGPLEPNEVIFPRVRVSPVLSNRAGPPSIYARPTEIFQRFTAPPTVNPTAIDRVPSPPRSFPSRGPAESQRWNRGSSLASTRDLPDLIEIDV